MGETVGAGGEQGGQDAGDLADGAVETELPDHHRIPQPRCRCARRQHGQGRGEIEVGAGLAQRRRGHRHDDLRPRPRQAGVGHGGAHAVLRLAHRGVAEADEVDAGQAGADVRLDGDRAGRHPVEGDGADSTERHVRPPRRTPRRSRGGWW